MKRIKSLMKSEFDDFSSYVGTRKKILKAQRKERKNLLANIPYCEIFHGNGMNFSVLYLL